MIKITKYTEQVNLKAKVVAYAFEFQYMNSSGITNPARVEFSQIEFEENRKNETTTIVQYFERLVRDRFKLAPSGEKKTTVNEFTEAEAIKTKLGTDTIE